MTTSPPDAVRVVIVDDSRTSADLLRNVLHADPRLRVVEISTAKDALTVVQRSKPSVVVIDIFSSVDVRFATTRSIMETCPTPIVIVGGASEVDSDSEFRAIEAGALAITRRPNSLDDPMFETTAKALIETVAGMSEVKVVRRWPRFRREAIGQARPQSPAMPSEEPIQAIAIGASTGGPMALQTILSGLPGNFPTPILVVQHMARGFAPGFVEWLSSSSGFPVKLAADRDLLRAGQAYVAPDGFHMGVRADNRILLSPDTRKDAICPSVSFLFRSVEAAYGARVVAVLLTGMGSDGAVELKSLRNAGAVTIVQDEESSVVYGMPGQAAKIGAAQLTLAPENIAKALITAATQTL